MTRYVTLILASLLAMPAAAEMNLALSLGLGQNTSVQTAAYHCSDDTMLSVHYVIAGPNRLAVMPLQGETRLFVNVLSASGARYASGALVWWSRGDTATLENLQDGEPIECVSVP